MPYLWIKALHVAAVLLFVGGLFLQALALRARSASDGNLVALARFWDRRVTVPAMLVLWLAGVALAAEGGWFGQPWLWLKLVLVVLLTGLHGVQSGKLRRLAAGVPGDTGPRASLALVVVAACAACIAILVVAKPI